MSRKRVEGVTRRGYTYKIIKRHPNHKKGIPKTQKRLRIQYICIENMDLAREVRCQGLEKEGLGRRDGKKIETVTTGAILNPVTGAMQAAIGALVTTPTDPALSGTPSMLGYGKLSASLDEFRYWKDHRNSKQIGQNWFSQVGGGTNTDAANTTLTFWPPDNDLMSV